MSDKFVDNIESFRLRSEKVRNLMGAVPSSLIKYGVVVIILILLILVMTASIIPYTKTHVGKVLAYEIYNNHNDSIEITLSLEFEEPNFVYSSSKGTILLGTDKTPIVGRIIHIVHRQDLDKNHTFQCVFLGDDLNNLENKMTKFKLIIYEGSLLKNIFIKKKIKG